MRMNYCVIDVAGRERYDGASLHDAMGIFATLQVADIEGRLDDEGCLMTDMDCGYGASLSTTGDINVELLNGACNLSGCWDCSGNEDEFGPDDFGDQAESLAAEIRQNKAS